MTRSSSSKAQPAIVLVGTQHPGNIGSVCRTMRNFGLEELVLVAPTCEVVTSETRAMSAGAYALAESARRCENLEEALQPYALSVGFTRRSGRWRQLDGDFHVVLDGLKTTHPTWSRSLALVFGPEESGLSNEDLQRCDLLVKLPTTEKHGSMNLSHAVTCACYEITRQTTPSPQTPTALQAEEPPNPQAALQAEEPPNPQAALQVEEPPNPQATATFLATEALYEARTKGLESLMRFFDRVDFYTVEPRHIVKQRLRRILWRSLLSESDLRFLVKLVEKLNRLYPANRHR